MTCSAQKSKSATTTEPRFDHRNFDPKTMLLETQHQRDDDTRQPTQQRESTWHQVSPRVQVMPQHLATPSTANSTWMAPPSSTVAIR